MPIRLPRRHRRRVAVLVFAVFGLIQPVSGAAYVPTSSGNAMVEAMLRMMELFGLIDRDHLALNSTFLPGYGGPSPGMMGGMPGLGGYPSMTGLGAWPGAGGLGGWPGAGDLGGWPGAGGLGGWPGASGLGGWPGMGVSPMMAPGMLQPGMNPLAGQQLPFGYPSTYSPVPQQSLLDGTWVLNRRGIAIIRGNFARLYLSREHYQDFEIRYDQRHLWLTPSGGGNASRYQYRMHDGRMIVRDEEGNYLLLRRSE